MNITNLRVERLVVHDVIKATQVSETPPVFSTELIWLGDDGDQLISKRIVDTVSSGSQCVPLEVDDFEPHSPFALATAMLECNDPGFIKNSTALAKALIAAQSGGAIKAGVGFFIQGTCMADAQPSRFLVIIKADSDQGISKRITDEGIELSFVKDMLLSGSQRLVKVAFFCELLPPKQAGAPREPGEFAITVFDHLMQLASGGDAALYFYRTFLRCRIADDSARKTKKFYEVSRQFIENMEIEPLEKVYLYSDLNAQLRSNKATVSPKAVAKEIFPVENQDAYLTACKSAGITSSFSKDTNLLKPKLKRMSLKFSSEVSISAPQEIWKESIQVKETKDGWTTVKIKGTVEGT